MAGLSKHFNRLILAVVALGLIIGAVFIAHMFWSANRAIFDLLSENRELRTTITNLTHEDTIAYAKILSRSERDGRLYSKIQFTETERDNPNRIILTKEYEIEGDVVYFDALVVKFGNDYVSDGRARALYLWRRVFGEKMPPESSYPIDDEESEPQRYKKLFSKLSLRDRNLFWAEIWQLAHSPNRLRDMGIRAVHGNAVYTRMLPEFVYVIKVTNTGQMTIEVLTAS